MSTKAITLIAIGVALPAVLPTGQGSSSTEPPKTSQQRKADIKVIRVDRTRSKYGGKHHMRAMSKGMDFSFRPGKVIGATILLEGPNAQDLQNRRMVVQILQAEAQKLGLFNPMMMLRNVHQSHTKPNMWNAIWDFST